MQLKHQEELGKRLKMNINTEKKLIKEVSQVNCNIFSVRRTYISHVKAREICVFVQKVQKLPLSQGHETERKTFETKMKAEYKLKKERWKREMESQETPKSQRNQGVAQPRPCHSPFFQGLDFLCPVPQPFLLPSSSFFFLVAFLSKQKLTFPSEFQPALS